MSHSAIVFLIDRLQAAMLGPYGGTLVETPGFNRLAAESTVFEWSIADSVHLDTLYRAYWEGQPATCTPAPRTGLLLPEALREAGHVSRLLTDDAILAEAPSSQAFDEVHVLADREPAPHACSHVGETHAAHLVANVLAVLQEHSGDGLLWVHAKGLAGPWDAPHAMREQLVDPDDPPPPDFVEPPEFRLEDDADPDQLFGIVVAYAAQVALIDLTFAALLDAIGGMEPEPLLLVGSPRGYPLGEHGRIGPCDEAFYEELLHTPLFLRRPRGEDRLRRDLRLVQPVDVHATVTEWFGLPPAAADANELAGYLSARCRDPVRALDGMQPIGKSLLVEEAPGSPRRRAAVSLGSNQLTVRNPAWFLRHARGSGPELYAKPDDRFEQNPVADRSPEGLAAVCEAAGLDPDLLADPD